MSPSFPSHPIKKPRSLLLLNSTGPGGSTSLPALLGAGGPGGPATQRRGSARRLRDARGVPAAHPAQRQRRVGSLPAPGRGGDGDGVNMG